VKRIDVLPDDVLLDIFDLLCITGTEVWQSLVHVCRRWRNLVFVSPRRLDLHLFCTLKTSVKDTLDVWPALPLIVTGTMHMAPTSGMDNIIAALGQSNRVCQVRLVSLANSQLEEVLAAMQAPLPELAELQLSSSSDETALVLPDSFLDGSAPRLRHFELDGIPFPGFPNLLLSANHLVTLRLSHVPHSGYISPEGMVALLSVLSSLETLSLQFQSPRSRPHLESRSRLPPERSILPALNKFRFKGVTEYLEDLVTQIDTPRLDRMHVTFFNRNNFGYPQLTQFINRSPKLRACHKARVQFDYWRTCVMLAPRSVRLFRGLVIAILCRELDRQLSPIVQVCNSSLHPVSVVEYLFIERNYSRPVWDNDAVENTLWLQLLRPFTAVKSLYLGEESAPDIAAALRELVGGRITEVLPSLQNIFVEGLEPSGLLREKFGQFVAARQLLGYPIAISVWE
jgi:hypothetical protein